MTKVITLLRAAFVVASNIVPGISAAATATNRSVLWRRCHCH
jgi:hypothetical protein